MKILFLGMRGFPNVQGGVESHAENLCPILRELGCEVEVIGRSHYLPPSYGSYWGGVRYRRVWSPKSKSLEAIVHTFLGVIVAAVHRPDVLHIHAVGPALMTPLARLLGLSVVVTHHGPDYDREKWGRFAKWVLRTGEALGMRYANGCIAISTTIQKLVSETYQVDARCIPNGVKLPVIPTSKKALKDLNLEAGKYVLMVSRIVPEKRHLDLIRAFSRASLPDWRLVLVGASDHPDEYVRSVMRAAADTPNVIMTGFQTGLALQELFAHAGMFVLPSSHEGLPIALLEALSYGLNVIASNIPANTELGLGEAHYFELGNIEMLAEKLWTFASSPISEPEKAAIRRWLATRYDWRDVAIRTFAVYGAVTRQKYVHLEA